MPKHLDPEWRHKEQREKLWCKQCERFLPLQMFSADGRTPAGTKKYKSRCRSCLKIHREKNHPSYNKFRILTEYVKEVKQQCAVCGYDRCKAALDFHHVDPNEKESTVYEMVRRGVELKELKKEIEKCIVLCANCHREHHSDQFDQVVVRRVI